MKKITIFAAALLLCSCASRGTDSAASAEPSLPVDTETPATTAADTTGNLSETDAVSGATAVANRPTFNGTFVIPPEDHATVTLTMNGTIKGTTLLPGTYVRKGAVLATLENPSFIELQQLYLDSHARNDYLRAEYLRQQTLSREEAASQKKYQESRAEYFSMRSRMDAAAAQLLLLGVDTTRLLGKGIVPYLEIKAPIGGYVSNMRMNVGKHFGAGEPLCEIIDKSRMMLRLTTYEKDLTGLYPGQRIEFRVNGMGNKTFRAVLVSIGQQVDAANRSVEVYARIEGQNPQFRPGMYVSARIVQE